MTCLLVFQQVPNERQKHHYFAVIVRVPDNHPSLPNKAFLQTGRSINGSLVKVYSLSKVRAANVYAGLEIIFASDRSGFSLKAIYPCCDEKSQHGVM